MKKSIYIFALTFVSIVYTSCTSSEPKPEELAVKQTFALLQQMDSISQSEFNSYFISLDELREIAKDTSISKTFRNAVTNVSKDIHGKRLQQSYDMIKESGKRFKIDWKGITFREYPFIMRDEDGITLQDGFVAFDYKEKKFVTKIVSIKFKNEQRLFNLSNIEPVRKQ